MPPVRDLIPAEGDDQGSDDDLEIGGVSQNFRCPLTTNLLEDPLTKCVPSLSIQGNSPSLATDLSPYVSASPLQYQLHTLILAQRYHGICCGRQQPLSCLVVYCNSHPTNTQARSGALKKGGGIQEKRRGAYHCSTSNFDRFVLISWAYLQARIQGFKMQKRHRLGSGSARCKRKLSQLTMCVQDVQGKVKGEREECRKRQGRL